MPGNKCCCQAVLDYFLQLFCVRKLLNLFSAKHRDARNTGTSSVSLSENNNGPTTVNGGNHFLTCCKYDARNLPGTQEPTAELVGDVSPGYATLGTTDVGADKTSESVITDDASTPAVKGRSHFLKWRKVVSAGTPSWSEQAEAAAATMGKRNTYPPRGETTRRAQLTEKLWQLLTLRTPDRYGSPGSRPAAQNSVGGCRHRDAGSDVVILRGYRDMMPLIRPPYCKVPQCLPTDGKSVDSELDSSGDSESSASSDDRPPWLPASELSRRCPHMTASEYATVDRHPPYRSSIRGASHPGRIGQSTVARNREKPMATCGCTESLGDQQGLPACVEEEESDAGGSRDASPVVVLGRHAVRFIRRPRGMEVSAGGWSEQWTHEADTTTATAGWLGAPAAPRAPAGGGSRRRRRSLGAAGGGMLRAASWSLWRRRCRQAHTVLPYAQVSYRTRAPTIRVDRPAMKKKKSSTKKSNYTGQ